MKAWLTVGGVVLPVVLIGTALVLWWKQPEEPILNSTPMSCINRFTINDSTAIPSWTTQTVIPAQSKRDEKLIPYEPLASFKFDEQPLALQTQDGTVVVDNEIFSDLQTVDVANYSGDFPPTIIGQITETDLTQEEWRILVDFLLKSHIIRTYAHLESELCMDEEVSSDSEYTAHFSGVHRYCTNDCYEQPLDFTLQVDKQSRSISVQ